MFGHWLPKAAGFCDDFGRFLDILCPSLPVLGLGCRLVLRLLPCYYHHRYHHYYYYYYYYCYYYYYYYYDDGPGSTPMRGTLAALAASPDIHNKQTILSYLPGRAAKAETSPPTRAASGTNVRWNVQRGAQGKPLSNCKKGQTLIKTAFLHDGNDLARPIV